MWEILTFGEIPYAEEKDALKLAKGIVGGTIRLQRPNICTEELYTVMQLCWNPNPTSRPTFLEILRQLRKLEDTEEPEISDSITINAVGNYALFAI